MKRLIFSLLAVSSAMTAFGQGIPYILNKNGHGTNTTLIQPQFPQDFDAYHATNVPWLGLNIDGETVPDRMRTFGWTNAVNGTWGYWDPVSGAFLSSGSSTNTSGFGLQSVTRTKTKGIESTGGSNYMDSVVSTNVATTNLSASKIDMVGTGTPAITGSNGVQFAVPSVNATGTVSAANVRSSLSGSTNVPGIVSVADFGSDSTGVADSTAAFNAAVAALPTGNGYGTRAGGVVLVPFGTYKLDGTVTLKRGVILKGDGAEGSFLTSTNTNTLVYFNAASGDNVAVPDVGVANLTLSCPFAVTNPAILIRGNGGVTSQSTVYIDNIREYGGGGIYVSDAMKGSVSHNFVQNSAAAGIHLDGINTSLTVMDNHVQGSQWGYLGGSTYSDWLHNSADGNTNGGFWLTNGHSSLMLACSAEGNGGDQFRLTTCDYWTLNGLYAINDAGAGLNLSTNALTLDHCRSPVLANPQFTGSQITNGYAINVLTDPNPGDNGVKLTGGDVWGWGVRAYNQAEYIGVKQGVLENPNNETIQFSGYGNSALRLGTVQGGSTYWTTLSNNYAYGHSMALSSYNVGEMLGVYADTIALGMGGKNIGVQTNNPQVPFHVRGSATVDGTLKVSLPTAGNSSFSVDNGAYGPSITAGSGGSGGILFLNAAGGELRIQEVGGNPAILSLYKSAPYAASVYLIGNGSSYLNGGNVGIGTNNPQTALHVVGTSGLRVDSGNRSWWTDQNGVGQTNTATLTGRYISGGVETEYYNNTSTRTFNSTNGNTTISGTFTATNGYYTTAPTNGVAPPSLVYQPIGLFGFMGMSGTTNTVTVGSSGTYYVITNFNSFRTNHFVVSTGASAGGYLTNLNAGFYRISYYLSCMAGNSDTLEVEVNVNGTGKEEISGFATYDNPARMRVISGGGILYLPANSYVSLQVNNRSAASNVTIWRGGLTIGTP